MILFSYETIITYRTEANWNLKFNMDFDKGEKSNANNRSTTTILQQTNKNM